MYLKTLTLRGFKSFASATRFEFEPGVTCVVGPNGSGKSNVVDALAWVMGEQGAKTLRGGKMEDVIFAGTTGRPALGRAEVSLTIDNSDGALPIEYSEVTITRTLFRNGGSEYAINGAACRLLDIQDLLSDSGLGREMHVIVGQGQLDAILRATPLERRGFIEEAAGVLKHRKRKEKALRKLDNMQGNLHRLGDLIAELRRQLGPLGRQAQAARKAAIIAAQVRDSGLRILADDLNTQINKRNDLSRALEQVQSAHKELSEHTELLRTRMGSLEQAAAQLSPKAQRAGEIVMTLTSQREQLRSIAQVAMERQRHLGTGTGQPSGRARADIFDQLHRSRASLEECSIELQTVQKRLADAEKERQANHEEHIALTRKREEEQRSKAAHRDRVAQLGAKVASQRARVEALDQNLTRLAADLIDAEKRLAAASAEVETSANAALAQPVLDLPSEFRGKDAAALKHTDAVLMTRIEELASEQRSLRASQLEVERQRATHQARVAAHEATLERALGPSKRLLEHDPGLTAFSQHLELDAQYEVAVSAALAHLKHSVIAHSYEQALTSARTATDLGLAAAVVAYPSDSSESQGEELPQGAIRASDVVRVPSHNRALAHALQAIVIAPIELARTILRSDPTVTVVTEAGMIVTADWIVSQSSEDATFSVQRALETEHALLAQLETKVREHHERLNELESKLAADQARSKTVRKALTAVQEAERAKENAQARILALKESAQQELLRLTQQRAESTARKKAEEETLAALVTEYETLAQPATEAGGDTGQLETRIAQVANVLERAREVETLARLDLRSAQEKHRNLENRVAGLTRQLKAEELAEQAAREAAQKRAAQAERARAVHDRANAYLGLIERSIARATHERDTAIADHDRHTAELNELRHDVAARDNDLRELTQNIHAKELQLATIVGNLAQLENRAIEEYGLGSAETIDQFGPHNDMPVYEIPRSKASVDEELESPSLDGVQAFDREYLERVFERATKALANLGKVNPLALEEYVALEERHKFLSDQLADLKKSRADLLQLVDDIDAKVQEVFASAFADTAAQFEKVFPRLFPGGEGKMYLTEPDDLLNTGIDIEARPAGKKVKRLSLLSGGERSLTAIAMLVSIFKARPSPFYVMDEVEAALDDVNLGRLLGVFKELQEDSQLIVITHQKRTMEIADALYGVTMQGDGISAVMSQRMDK